MNSILDLNLMLIARQNGEDRTGLPDLYVAAAPRRTARGREADSLVIYLSLVGNAPLTSEAHAKLIADLALKFYKTPGSVTAALRSLAETLNLNLLDRNLRSTGGGRQGIGQLLLAVLRGDTLYIAQSGAVQAYIIKNTETQAIYDLETSGRGLGLSQSTPVRFLQVKIAPGDYLLMTTIPAPSWSQEMMKHPGQQGMEALRHQLVMKAGQEYNAVIVQAQAGKGKLNVIRHKPGAAAVVSQTPAGTSAPTPVPSVEAPITAALTTPTGEFVERQAPGQIETPSHSSLDQSPAVQDATVAPARSEHEPEEITAALSASTTPEISPSASVTQPQDQKPQGVHTNTAAKATTTAAASVIAQPTTPQPEAYQSIPSSTSPAGGKANAVPMPGSSQGQTDQSSPPVVKSAQSSKETPAAKPMPGSTQIASIGAALAPIVAAILGALRTTFSTIGKALLRLLKNLLPDADVLHLPASTMVFIAIAIPLVLAVLGGVVYLQRGQAQQYQVFYQQAVEKADYAASLTNPLEQRLALQTALGVLDKAEQYTVTSQSQALRAKLTLSLDTLDAVKRLDYKQAIVNGLEAGVKVTRIVAAAADLYLLDGNTGSVLHAVMTSRGYELDPTFKCGPTQGYITVGPLIDIVELPPGGIENASLLGMDANGNLLYCVVGAQPYSNTLAPPNTGLGSPTGMSLDRGDLYVLDPSVNAVWIYSNMEVSQPPHLFFGDTVPPMQDVIDLEVYNDELFMLHADGHTTKCTYSAMAESPTRCDDPVPYSDNRPGRSHGPVIEDAVFNQMDYITFPERSIFYLDPQHQAIYYFSVLLTLQYQYQPKNPLAEGEATAFAMSANRVAFMAIGNNVYYAAIP